MTKKQEIFIRKQNGATIHVLQPTRVQAFIYGQEHREAINDLINRGYLPHHTSYGGGKPSKKHYNIEKYRGRFGEGYKMITTCPTSTNFSHITYFINSKN